MWKQLLEMGEEQVTKLATTLMANEKFMSGVQSAATRALEAKGALDRQLAAALHALQVPTHEDLQKLNDRLDELERIFEGLAQKLDAMATPEAPKSPPADL